MKTIGMLLVLAVTCTAQTWPPVYWQNTASRHSSLLPPSSLYRPSIMCFTAWQDHGPRWRRASPLLATTRIDGGLNQSTWSRIHANLAFQPLNLELSSFAAAVNIRKNGALISSAPTDLDFIRHFTVSDAALSDSVVLGIDQSAVFNWTGQHNFDNGLSTFSYNSWIHGDSTATLTNLVDSLANAGGVFELGTGVFSMNTLTPDTRLRIVGTVYRRSGDKNDPLTGTVIKSTNNTGAPAVWLNKDARGSRLSDLTISGDTTKLNGAGLRLGNTTAGTSTLGNLYAEHVLAIYHDSSGFEMMEADGNSLRDVDSFFNRGYGIHVRSRNHRGIAPIIDGGRSFRNGLGGLRVDAHTIPSLWRFETIQDTTVGIYLNGQAEDGNRKSVRGASIIGCDIEPEFQKTASLPLSAFRFYNVRNATVANNYVGGGISDDNPAINGKRLVPRGVWMDSVTSAVFMNNVFVDVDSEFVVDRNESSFLLINNLNANPDSIRKANGGIDNWAEIAINTETTAGRLWIDARKGLYLSPRAENDIDIFPLAGEDENPYVNIWGDSSGTQQIPRTTNGLRFRSDPNGDGEIVFKNKGVIKNENSNDDVELTPASGTVKVTGTLETTADTKSRHFIVSAGSETTFVANNASGYIYMSTAGSGSYPFANSGNLIIQPRTNNNRDIVLATGTTTPSARVIVKSNGNVGIGTNSFGSGSTGVLAIGNGTPPSTQSPPSDGCLFYAEDNGSSSEMWVMDEAGVQIQISPHNPVTGEWEFYSKNIKTGRVYHVKMEKMLAALERLLHASGDSTQYIEEYFDEGTMNKSN